MHQEYKHLPATVLNGDNQFFFPEGIDLRLSKIKGSALGQGSLKWKKLEYQDLVHFTGRKHNL